MSHGRLSTPCLVLMLCCPRLAPAQTLEVGVSLAGSCRGSDGSFCSSSVAEIAGFDRHGLRTPGLRLGIWLADWIEVSGRVAWFEQPDRHARSRFPDRADSIQYAVLERRRTIVQGEVTWHYRRGKRVRPNVGVGIGGYRLSERVTCEPAGCESELGRTGLSAGPSSEWHHDVSVAVGISVLLHPRVRVRGGRRIHNPWGEHLALSETFAAIGYRFGPVR